MQSFSDLLDRLVLTPSRTGKLTLLRDYLFSTPDPDRGWALAALTGNLDLGGIKPALFRTLAAERVDPELFALSYDFVGDLAETVSLIWPDAKGNDGPPPSLSMIVEGLMTTSRSDAPARIAALLDRLSPSGRFALIKLSTGGMRVGVSARLVKQALADHAGIAVEEIEEIWHGLSPPYSALFAWLEGRGDKPDPDDAMLFRPVMLAHPLDADSLAGLDLSAFAVEWKWDGIRVQLVGDGETARLYSRSGDDISAAFPELSNRAWPRMVIDGELLVRAADGTTGSFSDLQQRLNRRSVSRKLLDSHPAFIRAYDVLMEDGADLRPEPFSARRSRLEQLVARLSDPALHLSEIVTAQSPESLDELRNNPPESVVEGVMLKRLDSPYLAGRPRGLWWKWKIEAMRIDAVLLYAQRGHGKRSGLYSDYTFAVWKTAGNARSLVPVGKAYSGFTDEELKRIDKFVRDNTVDRFGPVRAVRADEEVGLVLEIAFEGINRSSRHKSGLALRFPRIARVRWDKPSAQADDITLLEALIDDRKA